MTRRWLQSADVEIDDSTGALLVKVGDAELQVDMAEVDVSAIVAGIAGAGTSAKTLADLMTALSNIPTSPAREDGNLATIASRLLDGNASVAALLAVVAAVQASTSQTSSGTTAKATTDDNPVELVPANASHTYYHCRIFNSGTVPGFFSLDGGTTWHYLPAACSLRHDSVKVANQAVQIKRIVGGSNVTGVFASLW